MKIQSFNFKVNGESKTITVKHDLPNVQGLNIEAAFENWKVRTKKFTVEDFCAYIKSKKTGYRCIPFLQDEKIK